MLDRCPKCGYSLVGLPADHACPECGLRYDPVACAFYPRKRNWLLLACYGYVGVGVSFVWIEWLGRANGVWRTVMLVMLPVCIGGMVALLWAEWTVIRRVRAACLQTALLVDRLGLFTQEIPWSAVRSIEAFRSETALRIELYGRRPFSLVRVFASRSELEAFGRAVEAYAPDVAFRVSSQ